MNNYPPGVIGFEFQINPVRKEKVKRREDRMTDPINGIKLKPCPFCGTDLEEVHGGWIHPEDWTCPVEGFLVSDEFEAKNWNRRHNGR